MILRLMKRSLRNRMRVIVAFLRSPAELRGGTTTWRIARRTHAAGDEVRIGKAWNLTVPVEGLTTRRGSRLNALTSDGLARLLRRDTISEEPLRLEDLMKRLLGLVVLALVLVSGAALAQQTPAPPGPDPGHQMPMQGGMCPMMSGGGMMGGGMMPMMGMTGGQSDSPRMMQMRGEMMKAMGEVMMKYGKMMEGGVR